MGESAPQNKVPLLPVLPAGGDANHTKSAAMAASLMLQNRMDSITSSLNQANDVKSLQKRVKALEEDNLKMKLHLKESEDAVKSYRGFLTSRNNPSENSSSKSKLDSSTQTDYSVPNNIVFVAPIDVNDVDIDNIAKIALLQSQIETYQNDTKLLAENNKKLVGEISKLCEDKNSNIDIATKQYVNVINEKVDIITKLNKEIDSLKCDAAVQKDRLGQSVRSVAADYLKLRKDFVDTKRSVSNDLRDVYKVKEERDILITVFGCSIDKANKVNEEKVDVLQLEVLKLKSEIAKYSEKENEGNRRDILVATTPEKCKACILHKQDLDSLNDSHRKESADVSATFNATIAAVADALCELQKAHYEEIDAVSKVYHVRDLQKIASMREVTLERDKLGKELGHCHEVISALNFSISTAEVSLSELQPHVVAKLAETRARRLKLLEKELRKQKKDIDQRSSDLCTANSTYLEQFQIKAVERHTKASAKFKSILEQFVLVNSCGDSVLKIYVHNNSKKN